MTSDANGLQEAVSYLERELQAARREHELRAARDRNRELLAQLADQVRGVDRASEAEDGGWPNPSPPPESEI